MIHRHDNEDPEDFRCNECDVRLPIAALRERGRLCGPCRRKTVCDYRVTRSSWGDTYEAHSGVTFNAALAQAVEWKKAYPTQEIQVVNEQREDGEYLADGGVNYTNGLTETERELLDDAGV